MIRFVIVFTLLAVAFSGTTQATVIDYEFHGSANLERGTDGKFMVTPDAVTGNDLVFEDRITGDFLGNGGFDPFVVDLGVDLNFWFVDQIGKLVNLTGTITRYLTVSAGDFSFIATQSDGEILQITASNSAHSESIDGWGRFEPKISVPEPASLVLLGLGLVGIGYTRRKKSFS